MNASSELSKFRSDRPLRNNKKLLFSIDAPTIRLSLTIESDRSNSHSTNCHNHVFGRPMTTVFKIFIGGSRTRMTTMDGDSEDHDFREFLDEDQDGDVRGRQFSRICRTRTGSPGPGRGRQLSEISGTSEDGEDVDVLQRPGRLLSYFYVLFKA